VSELKPYAAMFLAQDAHGENLSWADITKRDVLFNAKLPAFAMASVHFNG
jgi:hypothetical protein